MELGKKKVQEFEFRGRQVEIERKEKRVCDQEGGGGYCRRKIEGQRDRKTERDREEEEGGDVQCRWTKGKQKSAKTCI